MVQCYNRYKLNGYEFDIYIEQLKIAIEYDGYYAHSSEIAKRNEIKKDEYCSNNGIKLIRIKEVRKDIFADNERIIYFNTSKRYYERLSRIVDNLCRFIANNLNIKMDVYIDVERDATDIWSKYLFLSKKNSLEELRPDLCKEWNYDKNVNMLPSKVTIGSRKKVWWKCKVGHEWMSAIVNRVNGTGCPYCSNKSIIEGYNDLKTLYPDIAKEWSEKNEISPKNIGAMSSKKVVWLGKCGHEWKATVAKRVSGRGCPICSGKKVLKGFNDFASANPELCVEWDFERNENAPDEVTKSSNKKVWWICHECGNSWETSPAHRSRGRGCNKCAKEKRIKGYIKNRVNKNGSLKEKYPEIANELIDNNINSLEVTTHSNKYYQWKCKKGHIYGATVTARVNGNGCPYCSNIRILPGYNDFQTKYPTIAAEWNYEKNLPLKVNEIAASSNEKVWWRCSICGKEWQGIISARKRSGVGCTDCKKVINNRKLNSKKIQDRGSVAFLKPSLVDEWNYEKNKLDSLDNYLPKSNKKVWWKCELGHEWRTSVQNRFKGSKCPICSNRVVLQGYNDFASRCPDIVEEWDLEKNGKSTPYNTVFGSGKEIWWKCKNGHEWKAKVYYRVKGKGKCPFCNK